MESLVDQENLDSCFAGNEEESPSQPLDFFDSYVNLDKIVSFPPVSRTALEYS